MIACGVGNKTAYAVTIYDNNDTDNTDITMIQILILITIIKLIIAHKINLRYLRHVMEIQLKMNKLPICHIIHLRPESN